ncbi:MAG TPA: hypothetical protein VGE41_02700 [Verrucomicrobiae bacterium]
MNAEKEKLLIALRDQERAVCREQTFSAAGRILRHRRWRRAAGHALVIALVLGVAAVSIQNRVRPARVVTSHKQQPAAQVQSLSDDELLALFPDTPVGLATVANGKQRLIFPRPGDEQRFITHL